MSTVTDALEVEVAAILALRRGGMADPRSRAAIDRHFARILRLIAPRIRHFIRAYGLIDWHDDAAQACAIGVHRAICAYDPAKARFTTFVNWQLRGELQGLRHRVRLEQRASARGVGAVVISLDQLGERAQGTGPHWEPEDEAAQERTESLACEALARRACGRLLDDYTAHMRGIALRQLERRAVPRGRETTKPGTPATRDIERIEQTLARERAILAAHLLGDEDDALGDGGLHAEQRRQIARRGVRVIASRARIDARFRMG
jgi:hypothetical protein